jgi:hypothetical protein
MERLPINTTIIGLLAKEGKPLKLAEIYKKIKSCKSKPTVYRHLQRLVDEGTISQNNETYILAHGSDAGILAADLARISELEPVVSHFQKGFKLTAYSSENGPIAFKDTQICGEIKRVFSSMLKQIDPNIENVFESSRLTEETAKKLIGLKLVLVASFDGTSFSTYTLKDVEKMSTKRKEALRFLAKSEGLTLTELSKELQLNTIQVRQIIDPILASGFADMDEGGKVRLNQELRMQ